MYKLIKISCLILISNYSVAFHLQTGDLLFQDLNCGKFCDGINSVTIGYRDTYVAHIAIVVESGNTPYVIEALNGVVKTPLAKFLNRSLDENGHPRVMVGRLNPEYRDLIPNAVKFVNKQIGKPYNASFMPNNGGSYYCSELVYKAFIERPDSLQIFHLNPMNFEDTKTHKILPIWQDYYQQLHARVPQGVLGTNPGHMSRESSLKIIYFYGKLRTKP